MTSFNKEELEAVKLHLEEKYLISSTTLHAWKLERDRIKDKIEELQAEIKVYDKENFEKSWHSLLREYRFAKIMWNKRYSENLTRKNDLIEINDRLAIYLENMKQRQIQMEKETEI